MALGWVKKQKVRWVSTAVAHDNAKSSCRKKTIENTLFTISKPQRDFKFKQKNFDHVTSHMRNKKNHAQILLRKKQGLDSRTRCTAQQTAIAQNMADAESGKGEGEGEFKSRLWNKPPKGPPMDFFHSTVFTS